DAAAWEADPHGVALMDVPFYLAQAEYAGVADIMIAAATDANTDQVVPIAPQSASVISKALRLAQLKTRKPAEKKVAIMFWNYPPGEKNLGASFMNLPKSLDATLAAMRAAGYVTSTPGDTEITSALQQLLAPSYREPGDNHELNQLIDD